MAPIRGKLKLAPRWIKRRRKRSTMYNNIGKKLDNHTKWIQCIWQPINSRALERRLGFGGKNFQEILVLLSNDIAKEITKMRSNISLEKGYPSLFVSLQLESRKIYVCYLPAGRSVYWKSVTEVLKMLPEAAAFSSPRSQFFTYGPTLSRQITYVVVIKLTNC